MQSRVDSFLFIQRDKKLFSVLVNLQVNDVVIVGTESFLQTEDKICAAFISRYGRPLERPNSCSLESNGP